MHALALSPFHAGSHAAFLDGWQRHGRHRFARLTLPGRLWKWRMRGAAVTFADRLREEPWSDLVDRPSALWCTDMLDLAAFRGLAPRWAAALPAAVYFHENQLTYPVADRPAEAARRDEHFAFTNLTAALSAEAVWFNSAFHRDAFLAAAERLCGRLPDAPPRDAAARIEAKAAVLPPGIEPPPTGPPEREPKREPGPMRLVWVSRWEHDKRPETFFAALDLLRERGVPFEVSVLGERYAAVPACFAAARERLGPRVRRWGFLKSRAEYEAELRAADAVVSTAGHEFFGLAVAEAAAAGCVPVVPRALAYPEVWGEAAIFHDNAPAGVADALAQLAAGCERAWRNRSAAARDRAARYHWPTRAAALDAALERLVG
ncbi:DUF3524 domain-containing protein [Alienimonas sp. DA493]|uniref:tRNA-queuosine alpha-mannosyltransferase domain-containing protein n=1 Tax=Alienimonas sp. DA493 TaxID=3373605 RepID=UPI003754F63A